MKESEVPFGYEKDGKLFLSSWSSHPDREIGEVRDNDISTSAQFFLDRYEELKKKIEEVTAKIDTTENKGSFLMKLLHLKELLPKHDGLGDYETLFELLVKYENLVTDIIQKNRKRNSEIKAALIDEARSAVEAINWKEGTEKVNDLKTRWIKTGNAEEGKNEQLEETFWELIKGFFDRKKNFYEDKQKLIDHRKKQYEELVAEAEKTNQLYGRKRFDRVKELKDQWKTVGGVPNEIFSPLIEQFNSHLKPPSQPSNTDYSGIMKSLADVKSGLSPFDKKELDRVKKNVFRDKGKNPDKSKVLELIQLLVERDFINKLTTKRFPNFSSIDRDKKKSIRTGIIRDLITRDKEELKIYEENSSNFTSTDGKMSRIVEGKLKAQKRKISVKETLLEWVENDDF